MGARTAHRCDVLVIGAGIVGISAAYYLKKYRPETSVTLIDSGQPMAFTSAHSGENYRNWWPHPIMTQFTDRSIDLMEEIAQRTDNRINLTRRGYVLATRNSELNTLMSELEYGYSQTPSSSIREHGNQSGSYQPPTHADWLKAPTGVDVVRGEKLIQQSFPSYDQSVQTLIHVRRAGSVDSQQMGQHMLEDFVAAGGVRVTGHVDNIETSGRFVVNCSNDDVQITAEQLVNAAGPFIGEIASMLGGSLPVSHTVQQKIAFEDKAGAIPRDMPFSIDLDSQFIDWSEEERALLSEDEHYARYAQEMPGAIHCRPDGGDNGSWVKLGWAFNDTATTPLREPTLNDAYPEIVLRGAARLNPSLKSYYGCLPKNRRHYGGYYTLTKENWPLVGPMNVNNAFVVGAMSGFGTMAACASGELCAQWVFDLEKPEYADALSLKRYENGALMREISSLTSRGIL